MRRDFESRFHKEDLTVSSELNDLMMPTSIVLNELDEFARQWDILRQEDGGWECRRARARRQFRTTCEVWFFENGGRTVRRVQAQSRNLSERGIGLVTKCVILQGVPIEVRIQLPGHSPLHLGGVVVFCRYTQRSLHEVGIALKACQPDPIFSDNPVRAISTTPWLQQAIKDLRLSSDVVRAITASAR
jgi:hypothetical protein